jgi:pyruvyltransferase
MKNITAFYIPTPDYKYTNFGDILTPFILSKFGINVIYESNNPQLIGIGSLIHMLPKDTNAYLFGTGLMYPVEKYHFQKDPIAVRGNLTKAQFQNDMTNTAIGDGGLILENVYKPKKQLHRYKLGVFPNYVDIVNMRDDPIEEFKIFKQYPNDVLLIDPRNYVETVLDQLCSCDNIITSSLHGAVASDSYEINYGIFESRETQIAIHRLQGSFKFRDYFSAFEQNFSGPGIYLDKNTSVEKALSICRPVNKPTLNAIKLGLLKSIDKIKEI